MEAHYTSNLGEPVKCSFNKNGNYDFIIKSDGEEKKETIKVDSIRTSAQTTIQSKAWKIPVN